MQYELLKNTRVTRLDNGAVVLSSNVREAQSVAFGLFVKTGGRYESAPYAGASHFLEHMLFKGTSSRSALEITQAIEGRGGYLNAYTDVDATCFYVKIPYEDMKLAAEVVTDMYLDATLDPEEYLRERDVILEEMKMYDDQPRQVVEENFEKALFGGHPLGRPIVGDGETLNKMTRDMLKAYKDGHYVPNATVFSFAGRIDHEACVAEVERMVGAMKPGPEPSFEPFDPALPRKPLVVARREVTQTQAVLGFRSMSRHDERRYALRMLNCILGGNMSSRLFQEVREKKGLCYAINSFANAFDEAGMFCIATGTDPNRACSAIRLISKELGKISRSPVDANELKRAKDYVVGTYRMGLESTSSQMLYLGETYLQYGKLPDQQEVIERMQAVTPEDIQAVARELFDPDRATLSLLVPKDQPESDTEWIGALQAMRD